MKNLLLSAALLLSSFGAIAQLFVEPNGATDSFVYVSDQVLFVEQDIEMTANPTAALKASIYLRDGGQLIQGASSSDNSGSGKLSVYQNAPNSDQYTYNYWCSPVSITPVGVGKEGNKNFGLFRLFQIDGVTESTQTQVEYNGLNGSSSPLTIANRWIYYKPRGMEEESAYVWAGHENVIPAGMGFTMKGVDAGPVPTTGYEYDFRGRPNNGDIDVQVFNGEWTLTGNPYPSALDLNRVFWDSDNVEILQFRYWDEDKTKNSHFYSENAGGYGTWIPGPTNADGVPTDPGFEAGLYTAPTFSIYNSDGTSVPDPGAATPGMYNRRFAPIGQGFLVEASSNGTITLKNSHRRFVQEGTANHSEFRLQGEPQTDIDPRTGRPFVSAPNPSRVVLPQLRINTTFGTTNTRQVLLAFSDNSTDGFDRGQDAKSPMDGTSEAYLPVGWEQVKDACVISTLPFKREKQIPITFSIAEQGEVLMTVIEQIKFDNNVAYLWDSLEHTFQVISDEGEATVTLDAGLYENRFFIVFKSFREMQADSQSKKEEILASVDVFQNNPVKQLEVGNPEGYEIQSANIFDMSGKLVLSESNLGNSNRLTFPTGNLSEGIYLVMLTTNDGITIDHKITVQNN